MAARQKASGCGWNRRSLECHTIFAALVWNITCCTLEACVVRKKSSQYKREQEVEVTKDPNLDQLFGTQQKILRPTGQLLSS